MRHTPPPRVFFKQRDNNFFPPHAWLLAQTLTQLPYSFLEAVLYSCIVYFMANFTRQLDKFFTFVLVLCMAR